MWHGSFHWSRSLLLPLHTLRADTGIALFPLANYLLLLDKRNLSRIHDLMPTSLDESPSGIAITMLWPYFNDQSIP